MPPWPIAMPSSTAMVLNSRGMPPAALIASDTMRPDRLQMGVAGDELGEAVGHRDDRLADVAAGDAGGPQQGAGAGHVPAVGDGPGTQRSACAQSATPGGRAWKTLLLLVVGVLGSSTMTADAERATSSAPSCAAGAMRCPASDYGLPTAGPAAAAGAAARGGRRPSSGVSVTWYTWLEQGRDINPSRQVLRRRRPGPAPDARPNHEYLLAPGRFHSRAAPTVGPVPVDGAPAHLQRLLDSLWSVPGLRGVAGLDDRRLERRLRGAVSADRRTLDPADRNLLWLVFTDPSCAELLPNWEQDQPALPGRVPRRGRARLEPARRAYAWSPGSASTAPSSGTAWSHHDIEGFASRRRAFLTAAGELEFEHHRLALADQRDLYVVVYTPTGPVTAERLGRLAPLEGPLSTCGVPATSGVGFRQKCEDPRTADPRTPGSAALEAAVDPH